MRIPRYRRRLLEFEAIRLTADADWWAIADWCGGNLVEREYGVDGMIETTDYVTATVLEFGDKFGCHASGWEGDWLCKVDGGFWMVEDWMFQRDYERSE